MQQIIEKLLILQDRDRRILHIRDQLARMEPERQSFQAKAAAAQADLDAAKPRSNRSKRSAKSWNWKSNPRSSRSNVTPCNNFKPRRTRSTAHWPTKSTLARGSITELEDQQLELMEQAESVPKTSRGAATREADETRKMAEASCKNWPRASKACARIDRLESNRDQLTAAIEQRALRQYERLLHSKGDNVVVGIHHGVCGGCHMKFPVQLMVSCQAARELVTCPNCSRILYYTPDMDLAVAE